MNPKDIRTSSDPDLAGSYAAMLRAARSAEDVELTAADLIKLRDQEEDKSNPWAVKRLSNSQLRAGFFVHPTFT